ncbi:MAG: YhcN/YlaJ family sporulation lipoprotein [Clostridia bacterium]|nr:YhcN/YlaJ family sporulation lipoprotein [Clostridia bacterium]
MKMKSTKITAVALGLCMCIIPLSGCALTGKNTQRPNQNQNMSMNTPQNNRNLLGENIQGTDPNAGAPRGGTLLGGNQHAGSGNNPPDTVGAAPTPGTGTGNVLLAPSPAPNGNLGMNRLNQQLQQPVRSFDGRRAANIRNDLNTINGLNRVNAIVNGGTALISYQPGEGMRDANAAKDTIIKRVKRIDNTITDVVVSNSPDVMGKMDQLSKDIIKNRPMDDLNNNFDKIVQTAKSAR